MTENQRPLTAKEIAALPEGPAFSLEEHAYTDEDRKNGYIIVRGKRINVVVGCSKVMIPVAPEVVATYAEEDDPISYVDAKGVGWTLGRYADGRWFRQRH